MSTRIWKTARQSIRFLVTLVIVVASILWLSNYFGNKIPASAQAAEPSDLPGSTPLPAGLPLYTVTPEEVPQYRAVVGTVQAVHTADIGTKLMAQVKAVNVTAGKQVNKGDVLVELDDTDLQAKVRQARAQLDQARAQAEQAQWDYDRQIKLVKTGAITEQEFTHTRTNRDKALAGVELAKQALNYAQTTLSWTVIRSPINGIVVDKLVEAGDLVKPGQTLVRMYNRDKMQTGRQRAGDARQCTYSRPERQRQTRRHAQEVLRCRQRDRSRSRDAEPLLPGKGYRTVSARRLQRHVRPAVHPDRQRKADAHPGLSRPHLWPASAGHGQRRQAQKRRFVSLGEQVGDKIVVLTGLEPGEKIVANYGASSLPPATQPAGNEAAGA